MCVCVCACVCVVCVCVCVILCELVSVWCVWYTMYVCGRMYVSFVCSVGRQQHTTFADKLPCDVGVCVYVCVFYICTYEMFYTKMGLVDFIL